MKVVWAHNWFLDYRVSVFRELDNILDGNLYLIYNKNNVPDRVHQKVKLILGDRAIALENEKTFTIGNEGKSGDFANKYIKLRYQPGLYQKINEINPDVLIGEGFFRWGLVNLFASAFRNIPYVMLYERTSYTERNVPKAIYFARKFVLKWIDTICVNGTLSRKYIESMGVPNREVYEGHMVTDIQLIHDKCLKIENQQIENAREKYNIQGKAYLFIGQLIERKGVQQLLDAWKRFTNNLDSNEEVSLIIIGTGPLLLDAQNLAKNNNTIKVLGSIDHDELPLFFQIADIFIMPTLEDNWSMVVPEAMAASLPIITSIYNGCYYDLVTEKNGWVMDPLNPDDFLKTLNDSLAKQNKLEKMGEESWKIIKKHSPQNAAKSISEACKKAISLRKNI